MLTSSQSNQAKHQDIQISSERLWASLEELAQIGATPKGGVCRLAYSKEDQSGRALFMDWCADLGMTFSTDEIGNLFAYLEGQDPSLPSIMMGSHLDSQPTGGKYDGTYGVLSCVEVLRQLRDDGIVLQNSVEIVCWANEEGSRFSPALMGSSVFAGILPLADMLATQDNDGITVAHCLEADETWKKLPKRPERNTKAYLEIHIEQGPILEAEDTPIGIVKGVQAIKWYDVTVIGEETHAGPPPMHYRRDALMGAAEVALAFEAIAKQFSPDGRGMVGTLSISPGSRNVVPGQVKFTADFRHPQDSQLAAMDTALRATVNDIAERRKIRIEVSEFWDSPAVPFDPRLQSIWREKADEAKIPHMDIVSGAGHDAVPMAKLVPTGMLFIPCKDGKSHNEEESITPEQAAVGCTLLYDAVKHLAT